MNYGSIPVLGILTKQFMYRDGLGTCGSSVLGISFFKKHKQEGFFRDEYISQCNVAYRLEIASPIELYNEKSISLMVDKL